MGLGLVEILAILVLLAVAAFFAWLGVVLARRKGRSALAWGLVGLVAPLLLIVLWLLPARPAPRA